MSQFLTSIDLTLNEIKNARLQNLAAHPSSPLEGQFYYNTTDHCQYTYNGTAWVASISTALIGAASGLATLNSSSLVIQDPVNAAVVAAANKIVKADSSGKIDNAWLKTGTGNGIDADLLDGQHGSYYAISTHDHNGTYQPLDADLTAISGLSATSGLLKKTAANTWTLDTSSYLTSLTFTGDATGTGTNSIALTLANSGVIASTFNNSGTTVTPITVDAKGRITSTGVAINITPPWSAITSKPTTLSGYGITDALSTSGGTISGNLAVTGTFTVSGGTTTIESTTLTVTDPIITLGGSTAPLIDDNKDRGIEFRWHNGTVAKTGFFGYDDSTGYLIYIPDATNTSEVFTGTLGDIQATNFRGSLIGNASTVTNGVYTSGSYSDPSWLTISKSKVGLANVENTALSTWAGSSNITTVGAVTGTSFNSITGLASVNPLINGTVAVGTSTLVARQDHVHPTDTTRAAIAQTMFIGTTSVAINRASAALVLTGITSIDGNAATATTLATGRTIGITGDLTWTSPSFNGSANITAAATLANSGVTAATVNNSATAITPLTIDAKGRITATGASVTVTPAWASITSKPSTLSGYGITDATKKYAVTIGDGVATSITVTHNLNTMDVVVTSRLAASTYDVVYPDVQIIDVNSIRIITGVALATNSLRVTVIG